MTYWWSSAGTRSWRAICGPFIATIASTSHLAQVADEPTAHHFGREPHFVRPCLVLDQTPAAVSPARRYRHRPARIQIFLSDHDYVAHQCGDLDHRMASSQVTWGNVALPRARRLTRVVRRPLVAGKDPLWNHTMHAFADIDYLRHTTVPHDGGERVRLLTTHRDDLLTSEPMDGLLNGDFHRLIQIFVVTHENPVRLGFRPWPVRLQVLAHDWPNLDFLVGTLERRQVYLTVSLPAVGIAGPDQATLEKHRQIQGRTGLQLVQIHVRAVFPGPQRTGAPFRIVNRRAGLGIRFVRVDPDRERSGEGLQIDHDADPRSENPCPAG